MNKNTQNSKFILAPMAGYTDAAFRSICRDFGADMTVTEMVSAKALVMKNILTTSLLIREANDTNCFVQIFGHEPAVMAESVSILEPYSFAGIDINMGCPVRKIVSNGDGSALLEDIRLAEKIISSVKRASSVPVSVKFRLGVSDDNNVVDFAKMCEAAGADFVTIHFRTRVQMYSGTADYAKLEDIVHAVDIPVYANGDVDSKITADALFAMGASGVALGRATLGRPYIFSQIKGMPYSYNLLDTLSKHIELVKKSKPHHVACNEMKKHIAFYLKGIAGAKPTIVDVQNADSVSEQYSIVKEFLSKINYD